MTGRVSFLHKSASASAETPKSGDRPRVISDPSAYQDVAVAALATAVRTSSRFRNQPENPTRTTPLTSSADASSPSTSSPASNPGIIASSLSHFATRTARTTSSGSDCSVSENPKSPSLTAASSQEEFPPTAPEQPESLEYVDVLDHVEITETTTPLSDTQRSKYQELFTNKVMEIQQHKKGTLDYIKLDYTIAILHLLLQDYDNATLVLTNCATALKNHLRKDLEASCQYHLGISLVLKCQRLREAYVEVNSAAMQMGNLTHRAQTYFDNAIALQRSVFLDPSSQSDGISIVRYIFRIANFLGLHRSFLLAASYYERCLEEIQQQHFPPEHLAKAHILTILEFFTENCKRRVDLKTAMSIEKSIPDLVPDVTPEEEVRIERIHEKRKQISVDFLRAECLLLNYALKPTDKLCVTQACYERATRLSGECGVAAANVWFNQGQIQQKRGELLQAQHDYHVCKQICEQNPSIGTEHPEYRECLQALEKLDKELQKKPQETRKQVWFFNVR